MFIEDGSVFLHEALLNAIDLVKENLIDKQEAERMYKSFLSAYINAKHNKSEALNKLSELRKLIDSIST